VAGARDRIIESAKTLFAARNYRDVSVSTIAGHAKLSNSLFYRYFNNKEDLLAELVNESIFTFAKFVKSLSPSQTIECVVHTLVNSLCGYAFQHLKEMRILHEVEYTSVEAARRVHAVLDNYLQRFLTDVVNEYGSDVTHWFVIGPLRFSIVYHTIWMGEPVPEPVKKELRDFVLHGLDPDLHVMDHRVFDHVVSQIGNRDDTTKLRLLQAAEQLFGSAGFKETKVGDITTAAEVAQGTFYTYFKSKEEVLEELVKRTNNDFRHTLKEAIQPFQDRRDAEIAAYYAFLQFFKKHPHMYAVVREAEFFAPETANYYYERIKLSYLPPIKKAIEKGEFRKFSPEYLAIFLMGIGHYMGMDLLILGQAKETDFIRKLIKLSRLLYKGVKR